ncbi:MAG: site-specific DNA-methyltransferase [Polyangiaceae bacterium]
MKPEKIERRPSNEERLEVLRDLFPEVFTDGQVSLDRLKELLEGGVSDDRADEHYALNWPGKQQARRLANQPPHVTLRPVPKAGVDEETTGNMVIVGDNLQVLLALQKSYASTIKLVYIDPPYNTGNDFIYKDTFAISEDHYLEETRQADVNGRLVSNPQTSGRFHSNWLSFMYPRLAVAQRLLREDGFIVVSIDDAEVANLRLLMNTIFGEENFIATLVWDRNRKNDAKYFSVGHEYMLVYARNIGRLQDDGVILRAPKEGVEEVREVFNKLRREHNDSWEKVRAGLKAFYDTIPDDDPRKPLKRYTLVDQDGPYEKGNLNWPGTGGPKYEVLHPITNKPVKVPASGWRYSTKARFDEEFAAGRIVFGPDETTTPRSKGCLFQMTKQVLTSVQYSYAQTAAQRFEALFNNQRVFDNPKPFDDLATMINYLTGPDDVVLDFFAGSGSTGHGVWLANQKYESNRRFVLAQIDAPVDQGTVSGKNAVKLKLDTIDKITCERLRRASKTMKAEGAKGDLGFRVFKEDSPALARPLHLAAEQLEQGQLAMFKEKLAHVQPADLFTEVLLLLGFPLDTSREQVPQDSANTLWRFEHPRVPQPLLVCLDPKIDDDLLDALKEKQNHLFVCRDEALTDVSKARFYDALKLVDSTFKVL